MDVPTSLNLDGLETIHNIFVLRDDRAVLRRFDDEVFANNVQTARFGWQRKVFHRDGYLMVRTNVEAVGNERTGQVGYSDEEFLVG